MNCFCRSWSGGGAWSAQPRQHCVARQAHGPTDPEHQARPRWLSAISNVRPATDGRAWASEPCRNWVRYTACDKPLLYISRVSDKMLALNLNWHCLRYFFAKSYVWLLVRIVSMRRFKQVVKHRIWWTIGYKKLKFHTLSGVLYKWLWTPLKCQGFEKILENRTVARRRSWMKWE